MAKTREEQIKEDEIIEPSGTELTGEFTLKKDNPRILKGIIETLSKITDEGHFIITKKEFIFEAMDPSRICMVQLKIKKSDFDEYNCKKPCKIGLNLDDLDKIMRRSSASDTIELNYKAEDQKLKVKMKREDADRTRIFSLAILDIEYEKVPLDNILKIEYSTKWNMDPDLLVEAIKDAEIYSETLNIKSTDGQGLAFSSNGEIGEMNYEIGLDELVDSDIISGNSATFSLTFLKSILKIASITEKLEISLRTDHPLRMDFNILEGGELFYMLAPRIEDDNDMEEF